MSTVTAVRRHGNSDGARIVMCHWNAGFPNDEAEFLLTVLSGRFPWKT